MYINRFLLVDYTEISPRTINVYGISWPSHKKHNESQRNGRLFDFGSIDVGDLVLDGVQMLPGCAGHVMVHTNCLLKQLHCLLKVLPGCLVLIQFHCTDTRGRHVVSQGPVVG